MSDIEKIVIEAIRNKEIVKVEYNRKQGGVSIREMEPFDISPGKKTPSGPMKFWGWCLFHDSIEGKHMSGIISVKKTGHLESCFLNILLILFFSFTLPIVPPLK